MENVGVTVVFMSAKPQTNLLLSFSSDCSADLHDTPRSVSFCYQCLKVRNKQNDLMFCAFIAADVLTVRLWCSSKTPHPLCSCHAKTFQL